MLAFCHGIGEAECGDARYVRAGHRGSLHIAVIRTLVHFRRHRRKYRSGRIACNVSVAARRRDVTAGAVVGVACRQEVGRERGYRNIIAERPGVPGTVECVVAGREDDQTAVYRVAVRRGDEIGECVMLRFGFFGVLVVGGVATALDTHRALDDRSTVVGRVFECPCHDGRRARTCCGAGQGLARHDPYTVVVARAARYSADTDAVVVDRRYRACGMRPVTGVAVALCVDHIPGDGAVRNEIVPVIIIHVTVAVVIDARGSGHLPGVDPHVRSQVGVRIFHAFVDYGYDDLGISGREFPCLFHVDVRTFARGLCHGLVAFVDIVPLALQFRVVERPYDRTCVCRHGGRIRTERGGLAVPHFFELRVELDVRHFGYGRQFLCGEIQVDFGVELQFVPLVQAGCARALLVACVYREQAVQGADVQLRKYFIHGDDTRAGSDRPCLGGGFGGLFEAADGCVVEINEQAARFGVDRGVDDLMRCGGYLRTAVGCVGHRV